MMKPYSAVQKKSYVAKKSFFAFSQKDFMMKNILWERGYKWQAHLQFEETLNEKEFAGLLAGKKYNEIAKREVKIEAKKPFDIPPSETGN